MESMTGVALFQAYSRASLQFGLAAGRDDQGDDERRRPEPTDGLAAGRGRRGHRHAHQAHHAGAGLALQPAERAMAVTGPVQGAATAESGTANLAYRRSERAELQIRTQDGDTVRLKFRARDTLDIAAQASDTGTPVTELAFSGRSDMRIGVRVEGELSAGELDAIRQVVEQAGVLAEEFFSGGAMDAFATASALQIDADQLARVNLDLRVRERLTFSDFGLRTAPPAAVPAPTGSGGAVAADAVLPPATPGDAAPQVPAAATPVDQAPTQAVVPTDDAEAAAPLATDSDALAGSPAPVPFAAAALGSIAEFLGRLLDSFADAEPATGSDSAGPPLEFRLKLKIFESVLFAGTTQQAGPTGAAVPELVPQTLDAVAATRQPPLVAVA